MIRPIILLGDPLLSEVSAEVNKGSQADVKLLISDMFETMNKANGVGLSAVQVGVPLRIFVVDAELEGNIFRQAFINPVILKEFGESLKHPEGCLSVPGLAGVVERPEGVEIEWYDENWEYHKKSFSGFEARVIQHEYDHLEGRVYVDYLDTLWKSALAEPINLIHERKMEGVDYLWK